MLRLLGNYCLFLLFEIYFNAINCEQSTNCLVSSISGVDSGYFDYPLEYYDERQNDPFAGFFRNDSHPVLSFGETLYNCTGSHLYYKEWEILNIKNRENPDDSIVKLNFSCGKIPCFIRDSYVKIFHGGNHGSNRNNYEWEQISDGKENAIDHEQEESSNTPIQHSLCKLAPFLRGGKTSNVNENTTVNLIVLGGSVAAGYETEGCIVGNNRNVEGNNDACAFGGFVYRWLKHKFKSAPSVIVNHMNIAMGGFTTEVTADILARRMAEFKLLKFTSYDIILIDHSLNDLMVYHKRTGSPKILERSLEHLIRKIFLLSEGIGPTIYLMHTACSMGLEDTEKLKTAIFPRNYTIIPEVYSSISNHYRFRLLSYFDLIWNPYALNDPFLLAMRERAKPEHNHPPWHMHMWWAELIAKSIDIDMNECFLDKTKRNKFKRLVDTKGNLQLPPLLFNLSQLEYKPQESQCLNHSESYINIDSRVEFNKIKKEKNSKNHYSIWKSKTWKLMEDRKGKPGWISSFRPNFKGGDSSYNHTLQFTIRPLKYEIKNNQKIRNIGLHVYYLRTYEHAGVVEVYLCGSKIGEVDTLTADYEKFHVSMPALLTIDIGRNVQCYDELFRIEPPPKNEKTRSFQLEFVHKYKLANEEDSILNEQRKTQKVKLLSIQICRMF